MKEEIITLDLTRGHPEPAQVEWLRGFLARALDVLRDLLAADDDPGNAVVMAELEHLSALIAGNPLAVTDETGVDCLKQVRAVAERIRQGRAERRREMTAILALVRDAVATVGAEMTSLHSTIDASTTRFEAISEIEDPRRIKELLMAQVAVLKRVVAERREAWEAKQKLLSERMVLLEEQLQATRREASLDALTGVANRGTFDRECQERARRADSRFVLAILDVDDFKGINDSFGHAVGDRVLVNLAQNLRRALREEDLVARLGGDEFAVVARDLTLRQAESRFSVAVTRLFATIVDDQGPLPCKPTVSCGIAEFSAGDTPASLFERADRALYAAKKQGKNRVVAKARAFMRDLMAQ